jgi:hypothetical protein
MSRHVTHVELIPANNGAVQTNIWFYSVLFGYKKKQEGIYKKVQEDSTYKTWIYKLWLQMT